MREIKFRAWDLIEGKMILPEAIFSIAPDGSHLQYANQGYLYNNLNSPESHKEYLTKNGIEIRDEFVLMQFTGLHDKNGKEIYEGDILYDNKHWVVKILDGGAWALDYANGSGEKYLYPINKHLCVIGNIYENPELLNHE